MDYSVKSIKSSREYMEDEFSILLTSRYAIFGVYDGHGGGSASKFCQKKMIPYLVKALEEIIQKKNYACILKHITKVFSDIDAEFKPTKHSFEAGTTAVISIITDKLIILINCGDSRGILCDNSKNILMSTLDHKPNSKSEKIRIERAGGVVSSDRIDNILNLSRAIGDFDLKNNNNFPTHEQKVISVPDVYIILRTDVYDAKFLILASDGIWDAFGSQYILNFVDKHYKRRDTLDQITEKLIKDCEDSKKCDDNKTIILVDLEKY
uniref:PPM-type phosphatase domain-containing protein n=1 Tax=viral metagenome TaxID=1070528 RepID=A0A6C0JDN3_9ZZZZ